MKRPPPDPRRRGGVAAGGVISADTSGARPGVPACSHSTAPGAPEIVSLDVSDRLSGIDGADLLPLLTAQVNMAQAAGVHTAPAPVTAKDLSLPPGAYAGTYTNEQWGTLRVETKGGKAKRPAFYAVGAAEGLVLDSASPGWRKLYFGERFSLDKHFGPQK